MAGRSATSLEDVRESIESLRRYLREIERAPKTVLNKEASRIKREAKAEAPRKSGKLERSIRTRISHAKTGATILISASAKSTSGYDYSGIQHEHTGFRHTKGKAHYLRDPYLRGVERIKLQLKKKLKPPKKGGKK